MRTYSFEKLKVWNDGRNLVTWVYAVTKNFPSEEKLGLVSQMKRAAVSVVSNIAEGSSRKSAKDQAHFYQIAYSSLIELLNQTIIAADLYFLSSNDLEQGRSKIEFILFELAGLRNACLAKMPSKPS